MINFDTREISFYRNDQCLGVAFKNIDIGPNNAYFPAISLAEGQRVIFNFGLKRPFLYSPLFNKPGCVAPNALNEPECLVKNYYPTCTYLLDALKRYLTLWSDFSDLSLDLRLLVGCLLFDHLQPLLLADTYLIQAQFLPFLAFQTPNLRELVFDLLEVHGDGELAKALIKAVSERIGESLIGGIA